ncbi:hypothetical protein MES5069_310139 [Mesorhizobium escarrei]|uniref:Uncharacterized protein n=1 Tax=Mesorhizobium escarrei TaxID=666018 RepID=A0ABM9E027_9HYPH|nr:hypothetical protein MES5069_310139 [Mesorhizobium escarrei]
MPVFASGLLRRNHSLAIKSIAAFGAEWPRLREILAGTGLLPMLQPQVFAIVPVGERSGAERSGQRRQPGPSEQGGSGAERIPGIHFPG